MADPQITAHLEQRAQPDTRSRFVVVMRARWLAIALVPTAAWGDTVDQGTLDARPTDGPYETAAAAAASSTLVTSVALGRAMVQVRTVDEDCGQHVAIVLRTAASWWSADSIWLEKSCGAGNSIDQAVGSASIWRVRDRVWILLHLAMTESGEHWRHDVIVGCRLVDDSAKCVTVGGANIFGTSTFRVAGDAVIETVPSEHTSYRTTIAF